MACGNCRTATSALGCSPEPSHPNGAKLHDREPGENPTGLYRRTFSLPGDWRDPASEVFPQEPGEYAALPDHRIFMILRELIAPLMCT